jgi:chemosensory pili system protein ChpC
MAEDQAIRCMQLPLQGLQLLVPNSAVAEIIGYVAEQPAASEQPWLDGLITWRGVSIPVVSFEWLCHMEAAEPGARSRIAVLYNPLESRDELPYFGVILQDIPRGYIAERERMLATFDGSGCEYLAGHADPVLDSLQIPDLAALAETLAQQFAQ